MDFYIAGAVPCRPVHLQINRAVLFVGRVIGSACSPCVPVLILAVLHPAMRQLPPVVSSWGSELGERSSVRRMGEGRVDWSRRVTGEESVNMIMTCQ